MTALKGREKAVMDIMTWAEERDTFWTLPQVRDTRLKALRDMTDEDLRAEWRWARKHYAAGVGA